MPICIHHRKRRNYVLERPERQTLYTSVDVMKKIRRMSFRLSQHKNAVTFKRYSELDAVTRPTKSAKWVRRNGCFDQMDTHASDATFTN